MDISTVLHNQKVWFTSDGRLEVYSHRLAARLNKYFKHYDNGDYIFQLGEEAVFKVPQIEHNMVLARFLTRNSTQTETLMSNHTPEAI